MEEKIIKQIDQKIILENRKKLVLSGMEKVESATLAQMVLKTNEQFLYILGNDLHIDKLDINSGHIEITGKIDCIKFGDKKQSLFKRMFK